MGCFALGILLATLVASYFGMRAFLRERQLLWRQRRSRDFWKQISRARGYLAAKDLKRARSLWSELIASDPTQTIARTELARVLLGEGQALDALRLLDEARTNDKNNLEVLMLAYEVNLELGNQTAALDNLALAIQNHPTVHAVTLARGLAEDLERPDEAMRYHEMLYSLGARGPDYDYIKARLEFQKLLTEQSSTDRDGRKAAIKSFLKKHRDFPPALVELASIEQAAGNINLAAQCLVEAAKASQNSEFWYSAAKLWLKNNMPDAAISAARTAVREAQGENIIRTELDLIRLYIATNNLEEAEKHLNDIPQLANSNSLTLTAEQSQTVLVLTGLCLNRRGKFKEASDIWRRLSKYDYEIPEIATDFKPFNNNSHAPSPVLSTP